MITVWSNVGDSSQNTQINVILVLFSALTLKIITLKSMVSDFRQLKWKKIGKIPYIIEIKDCAQIF